MYYICVRHITYVEYGSQCNQLFFSKKVETVNAAPLGTEHRDLIHVNYPASSDKHQRNINIFTEALQVCRQSRQNHVHVSPKKTDQYKGPVRHIIEEL